MAALVGMGVLVTGWGTLLLLLAVFKWDWLSKHPILYLDRLHRWMHAEYDSNIRTKTIVKSIVITVMGVVFLVICVINYVNTSKLEDYIEVDAGETVPLAGGELVLQDWVVGDSIAIIRSSSATGQYERYVVKADTHDYGEALMAFTGIFTNTTGETLTVTDKGLKMMGVPADIHYGYQFNGSWAADHKMDADGNMNLAPGESAFLYFWTVLNKDEQAYPYVYVIHDRENYYKVDMDTLQPASAGELAARNAYETMQGTMENAQELAFDQEYYDGNIGYVTLKDILFKNESGLPSNKSVYSASRRAEDGKVFLDLVMEVRSKTRIRSGEQLAQLLIAAVAADGRLSEEGAEVTIGNQRDPIGEGQRYFAEVHYEVQVPKDAGNIQIMLHLGGNTYVFSADD